MSSVAPPPNPCLVAIILVVQSRAGPRFVYHYPPNPLTESSGRRSSWYDDANAASDSSSDDSSSTASDDDTITAGGSSGRHHGGRSVNTGGGGDMESMISSSHSASQMKKSRRLEEDDDDNSDSDASKERIQRASWEKVLGFGTDNLEKLLSPSRAWHKRRFEVGVGELAFIGWPCFVREDGTWKKAKRRRKKKTKAKDRSNGDNLNTKDGDIAGEDNDNDDGYEDIGDETDGEETQNGDDNKHPLADSTGSLGADKKETMTMFNVVFVLNPPELEYSMRIKEMYEHVVKKLGRALKWEQGRADYVWQEAQTILSIKEEAKENRSSLSSLYTELLSRSSLARALSSIHTSISSSRIASVNFAPKASLSLQIPPLTSISVLPSAVDSQLPGVWLTTANSVSEEDGSIGAPSSNPSLAKHFALLLLDNEASILKDIEASSEALAPPLAHYIRSSKPTKSFAQISMMSSISLQDIQLLASHLVYWRRARAIPPLHQRDTYIVSPNCDLRKLAAASAVYAATFPAFPSLPKMLSALSGIPRPFYTLIPSKDHKESYFKILAWLLRGGWVTQLRTFGWIKVSKAIKEKADAEARREREDTESNADEDQEDRLRRYHGNGHHEDRASFSAFSSKFAQSASQNYRRTSVSSSLASTSPTRYRTERPFPHKAARRPTPPLLTSSLILNPNRASDIESRWLDTIQGMLPSTTADPAESEVRDSKKPGVKLIPPTPGTRNENSQLGHHLDLSSAPLDLNDPDIKRFFPMLQKYLNGHDPLEKIAVREGLKRKYIWRILSHLGAASPVQAGPSGAGSGGNLAAAGQSSTPSRKSAEEDFEKVLVTVRHW